MTRNVWIAILCLLAGLPLAAWGLASGALLFGLLGLALVLVFVYLVVEALNQAANPKRDIPKSPDAAWNLKDQPAPGKSTNPPDKPGASL